MDLERILAADPDNHEKKFFNELEDYLKSIENHNENTNRSNKVDNNLNNAENNDVFLEQPEQDQQQFHYFLNYLEARDDGKPLVWIKFWKEATSKIKFIFLKFCKKNMSESS